MIINTPAAMERPYDILVNGRPVMTLWAADKYDAMRQARATGDLHDAPSDQVTAADRHHSNEYDF